MTAEEETKILEEIWKETTQKGRLLYSYEIKEILDRFIVKGEWKEWTDERWGGTTIYCPYCKEDALEKYIDGLQRQIKSNFCPNCGAKLQKGGTE